MYVSPTYDNTAAGSLASATLCSQRAEAPAPGGGDFEQAMSENSSPAPVIMRRSGWRRMVEVILSPISGPTFCPQRHGVSHS